MPRTDYARKLDREWENAPLAKHVDVDAMYDLLMMSRRQTAIKSIEDSVRNRKDNRLWADLPDPRFRRFAGRQDITHIPTDLPLEKLVMDKLGIVKEFGKPWICPKCKCKHQMAFPPPICPVCGHRSFIETKELNLKNE